MGLFSKNSIFDIDIETGWWDVSRVRALFNPRIASDVMKILLSPGQHEDVWMWRHEKNGAFSVQSGYRFFKSLTQHDTAESSNAHEEQKMWKAIWKMRFPNKVRVFAWRACKESLPSKQNLFKRKIIESFMEAVVSLLYRGDQGLLSRFFLIAWSFWYRRNKWTIEHSLLDPLQAANYAISLQKPVLPASAEPHYPMQKLGCWRAPPPGFCKLNVYAALFFNLQKAGVGAVLRDEKGNVLMAVSKSEHELHEPASVELLAMLRGLQFSLHLGISKVVLESDCLLMVEALAASEDSLSSQGNLLKEGSFQQNDLRYSGFLSGFSVGDANSGTLDISHLLFPDDTLISVAPTRDPNSEGTFIVF
ncbi:uncharacterized protein LOC121249385 [Juglans microcarpa x Juglans regia]|uniref:uncharacterized protein LOC121249385 n=1 Tax=Juglans microcarpa x Juglans regia TaxID=2249226 RepID=UPI001B7ED06A|nr:uncharacterized protein LOC121249385 [Juglans microcarpa x Juglans regia]